MRKSLPPPKIAGLVSGSESLHFWYISETVNVLCFSRGFRGNFRRPPMVWKKNSGASKPPGGSGRELRQMIFGCLLSQAKEQWNQRCVTFFFYSLVKVPGSWFSWLNNHLYTTAVAFLIPYITGRYEAPSPTCCDPKCSGQIFTSEKNDHRILQDLIQLGFLAWSFDRLTMGKTNTSSWTAAWNMIFGRVP